MRFAKSWVALAAVIGISPAAAQHPAQKLCFRINQMQGWKAPDNKTIFIRVNVNQYFRLDLSASCPLLTFPDSHLITKVRGSDLICSAVDWDLSVAQSPPGAFPEACIVKQMTVLRPQEVAAIPPKFRP
jgi:hypothetical protein